MKTYAFLLRYALLALPLACASLMSSCSDDDDGGTYDNGPVTVRLNVSAAQIGDLNGTRAEGDIVPADEHEFINTLKVYIVNDANQNAERICNEADAKARDVIRQALQEKQEEIKEIDRLKASREEFKNEYLKLLQHFMDDAQNSFPPELLNSSTPVGSAPAPAQQPAPEPEPVAVADPFAPIDNFGMDDLD